MSILLREYVRSIIVEGIVDDLKEKYPYNDVDIDKLSFYDPSKRNKYLVWAMKQIEDISINDIIKAVNAFHSNPSAFGSKDINVHSANDILEKIKTTDVRTKSKKKKIAKLEGSEKVYEDGSYVMFRIDTRKAAIEYGKGTKWCISMARDDGYWYDYMRNTVFYFLFDKENNKKYALGQHFEDNSLKNISVFNEEDFRRDSLFSALNPNKFENEIDPQSKKFQDEIYSIAKNEVRNSPIYKLNMGQLSNDEFYQFALKEPTIVPFLLERKDLIKNYKSALEQLAQHEDKNTYRHAKTLLAHLEK